MPDARTHRRFDLRRSLLIAGLVVVLGVVLTAGGTYWYWTRPERVRQSAEHWLAKHVPGRVEVGAATFSLLGSIELHDVELYLPRPDAGAGGEPVLDDEPAFRCPRLVLDHDPISTLLGHWRVETLVAHQPTCTIVRYADLDHTNLAALFDQFPAEQAEAGELRLPTIELRQAQLRVVREEGGRREPLDQLTLTLRGRPVRAGAARYDITWQDHRPPGRAFGQWQLELQTGRLRNVDGGLPWLSIETVMFAVDASYDGAGAWCELLGLHGTVRAQDFELGWGPIPRRSATIALQDAALAIPVTPEEQALPREDRYLRFQRTQGTITVTPEAIHADFAAEFHGQPCQVRGTLHSGLTDVSSFSDVAFDAELAVQGLTFPRRGEDAPARQRRFIERWPKLQDFFTDFDPDGVVDLEAKLSKAAGPDARVRLVDGRLVARGCRTTCRFFPYPLEDVTGEVTFGPAGIFIKRIVGRHAGGQVRVDGWLAGPWLHVPAQLIIAGYHIPLDDALYDAVDPGTRKLWDAFQPAGKVDVDLLLNRPAGTREHRPRFAADVTLAFDDLAARYRGLPYPLEHIHGMVQRTEERSDVLELEADHGSARITATGGARRERGSLTDLDLHLTARDLPLDDDLFEALPAGTHAPLRSLHADGLCDLETHIQLAGPQDAGDEPGDAPTSRLVHRTAVTLNNVSLQPDRLPLPFTNVSGQLVIEPTRLTVSQLQGECGSAHFTGRGAGPLPGAQPGVPQPAHWAGHIQQLALTDKLRAALPEAWRSALQNWHIDGALDAQLDARWDARTPAETLQLAADLDLPGVTAKHARFALPFADVRGKVHIDEHGLRRVDATARYHDIPLTIALEQDPGSPAQDGTLQLNAQQVPLDDTLRDLLPPRLQELWDRLQPSGSVDVTLAPLRFRTQDAGAAAGTPLAVEHLSAVQGTVRLHDVSLPGLGRSAGLNGVIEGGGPLVDRAGGTALSGRLMLDEATLVRRKIQDFSADWSYLRAARGEGRLTLTSAQGEVYAGYLAAQLDLRIRPPVTEYACQATVRNMQIAPFLNAGLRPQRGRLKPLDVRGWADIQIALAGEVGDPATRQGEGRVEVRDAYFLELPVMVAILHVINLTLPEDSVFDDGAVDLFVDGDRLELHSLLLRSESLAFAGSGVLGLDDQHLDVRLVSVNPRKRTRIPLVSDFVEGAAGELLELQLTGPLWQPSVRARSLPNLSSELRSLFRRRDRTVAPTPAEEPERDRPY